MAHLAVIPILVGPLQALLALLPALLLALGGAALALFRPSTVKKLALLLWSQKLVVAPSVAVVVLAVWYWPAVFPPRVDASAREATADTWPLWRGSLGRRGVVADGAPEPMRGQIQWRYNRTPMRSCYSSPAVVGNRVYATGGNFLPPLTDRGTIVALNADSGELVWQFRAEGYRATFSSPAVVGDRLVVGEGLHFTPDARIYAIDLAASEAAGRGVKLWSFRTNCHVESSPCIYDGKVYVGAGDDGFYCLDLEGDGRGGPKVLWHVDGTDYPDCESSPAAADGRVFLGLGIDGEAVVCLDADTGEQLWWTDTPYPVFGSPAIAGDRVVVGMGTGNYVQSPEQIAADLRARMTREGAGAEAIEAAVKDLVPAGEVWCLDTTTGEVLWTFTDVERTVLGSPAIADDRVYVGSRDHRLYCLDLADGSLIGSFDAGAPIVSGPAVGEELVYVVTQTGQLYGVARRTFRPVWSANLDSETVSSPAVARGRVYVGTNDGGLLSVGAPAEDARPPLWGGPGGGRGQSGWSDGSAVPRRAAVAWRYAPGDDGAVTSPAAYLDNVLYIGVRDGDAVGLARLTMETDGPHLLEPGRDWLAKTTHAVSGVPVVGDDRVAYIDGEAGDEGRFLRCADVADGSEVWRIPIAADATGTLAATTSALIVGDGPQALTAYGLNGEKLWTMNDATVIGLPLASEDLVFAATGDGDGARLLALDAPTGRVLWARTLEGRPGTGPVMVAGKLWIGGDVGLMAYDPADGELLHHVDCGSISQRLLCDGNPLVAACDEGLLIIDAAAGSVVGKPIAPADPNVSALLAGEALVYFDGDSLRRLDLADRTSTLLTRLYPQFYGPILDGLLVTRSHVLAVTERRGLICLRPRPN